jgi:hypothetical protein
MYSGLSPTSRRSSTTRSTSLVRASYAVNEQRLADDVEQRHPRIERRERILEDHLHLATQRAQPVLRDVARSSDWPSCGSRI